GKDLRRGKGSLGRTSDEEVKAALLPPFRLTCGAATPPAAVRGVPPGSRSRRRGQDARGPSEERRPKHWPPEAPESASSPTALRSAGADSPRGSRGGRRSARSPLQP